ncbi:MAG: DUF444 family protein [Burkholderiaceae bacterium]|nr:DUF444 family protein [Burkholderiaceae bacterium]
MSVIIDRRLNDRNKSAVNRERFLRRYKEHLQRSVQDIVAERSIRDMEHGGEVKIPVRDIAEPSFRHGPGGDREHVHTGNREYMPGDRIERPGGSGQGGGEGGEGDAQDGFAFSLSRDEFMQLFFDDLELPRLARTVLGEVSGTAQQRAGYARKGAPTSLSVPRSLRNALGRRIALSAAPRRELERREARLDKLLALDASTEPDALATQGLLEQLESEVELLRGRVDRVPFIDDIDLRYRNRIPVPRPVYRAVMFCLMDVSASMDEHRKDLAKRFFTLLYLFLTRKYEHVDVVFIRHTDDAEEVDEQRFFHERKSGGTVVLSALELMNKVVAGRYPAAAWNVYGAQASDGDAFGADPERSRGLLEREILPRVRYFAYIEVADSGTTLRPGATTLSAAYQRIESPNFAMRAAAERRDIYPVFRELFSRKTRETA